MTIQFLSMYLDQPKVGSGWRHYLVLKQGRLHARILCVENAQALKVSVAELSHGKPETFKARKLAKRIRTNARTYHKEDSLGVKEAVTLLRAEAA